MKIKLQDYSLISNEWIDKEIERVDSVIESYSKMSNSSYDVVFLKGQLEMLINLKKQLIPSEKLAEISFNEGVMFQIFFDNPKPKFLTSEIELL